MCCDCNKDDSFIKKVKQIIRGIIGSILLLYVCLIILANIPFIQQAIGSWVANALSKQIGSEVKVGKVDVGLFNRIIIDDIDIKDLEGKQLLKSDRTAVKIDLISLMQGKVRISNAQLFGLSADLRKANPDATPNYQFLIDAFSSDEEESKPIDLCINSFIMRNGNITYNVESEPRKITFDTNHLNIKGIDATLSLRAFTEDSLDLTIKRLNFEETNSSLRLKNLQAKITGNKEHGIVLDFNLKTYQSSIYLDTLDVDYRNYSKDKSFSFKTKINDSFITLKDFTAFSPSLSDITTPLYFDTAISGTQDQIDIEGLNIHTDDNSMQIALAGSVYGLTNESQDIDVNIKNIVLDNEGKNIILKTLAPNTTLPKEIENLGKLKYQGTIDKSGDNIFAKGNLSTDVGDLNLDVNVANNQKVNGFIKTMGLNLAKVLDNSDLGKTIFELDIDGNLLDGQVPEGKVKGNIALLEYKGHQYKDITIDASRYNQIVRGMMKMNDDLVALDLDATYDEKSAQVEGTAKVRNLNPHALNLTSDYAGETYNMDIAANMRCKDINSLIGSLNVSDVSVVTKDTTLCLNGINLDIEQIDKEKQITINTDFAEATLRGNIQIDGIVDAFKNQVAQHLPSLVAYKKSNKNKFDIDATITESSFLKHYVDTEYVLDEPVHISGTIDEISDTAYFDIDAPKITNDDKSYLNTHLVCNNSKKMLNASITTIQKGENGFMHYHLTADAKDDTLETLLNWDDKKSSKSNGMIYATTEFSDSIGKLNTKVNLHKSQFTINDTIWQIKPSDISIYGKNIICDNVKVYNDEQSILLNGTISDNPSDSLVADLHNIEVAYITEIVDFDAVRFKGQASGKAIISNVYNDIHLNANLVVNNLHLQEGRLGTGYIQAFWDNEIKGIRVNGHIIDFYKDLNRTTDVSGFIAPSSNDLDLKITTNNTNAEFLNGFLGSTFKNITGNANGELHVIGPLNDVNLVGDISADVEMTLRATDARYHINPQDSIHLRKYAFKFDNIRLNDNKGNIATVNGTLAHKNMKNFKYDFDITMNNLTVYDEKEFNSDKFYATVFVNGSLAIHGSDGHPLRMTADITPTKGSVFAYDAATPDAINTGSFVEFRDVTPKEKDKDWLLFDKDKDEEEYAENEEDADSEYLKEEEYHGDIFFDISIHVNPDCEIKLRMDNVEDGYMSTYGTGTLLAHYHNKSPFSLNGIYQIQGGKYRLYLQDIIYRDLELQSGSNVVFNGNPFDANIHLICHHTINSVPLRDLTATNAFNQNSKVKVICVLDITGKLGNMNFGFDIQLPNVNDETRQLVKSLISSEEEMNMQMIYLLGLGRFYSNEYARASGDSGSDQAVNTLLSSTISGQVNQMLSNIIGRESNWNFGTGLSTGEKGWNDLDVEGILSGKLLNDRLLINGNFGYRDNALTNSANFIGDFDIRWRLSENGNTYIKAYNQTNDRYFTKATLNTQGIGISYQRDFDSWKALFRKKMKEEKEKTNKK